MSLWRKPLDSINFQDIDEFCAAQHPEGLQLDYKRDIPADLAKTVAAFANTRGGLIVLGVAANTTDNKPLLPIEGMPAAKGISERILQICRDGIYPPVLPEISEIIRLPNDASTVFVVVRIDESREAPHSIQNGKKVYVRTGEAAKPIDLADIDRIEHLLKRRRVPSKFRKKLIARSIERLEQRDPGRRWPTYWCCVVPEFPRDQLFPLRKCRDAAFGGADRRVVDGYLRFDENREDKRLTFTSASRYGDIFVAESVGKDEYSEEIMWIPNLIYSHVFHAQAMYREHATSHPGLIRVIAGAHNVKDFALRDRFGQLYKCIDNSFTFDTTTTLSSLEDSDQMCEVVSGLLSDFFHAFNAPEPPQRSVWRLVYI
jgi:hypothetical protein